MDVPNNPECIRLNYVLTGCGLIQHVETPTYISGHTIDLIITRNNQDLAIDTLYTDHFLSDHCFILCNLDHPAPPLTTRTSYTRSCKHFNHDNFQKDLQIVCARLLEIHDLDELVHGYNNDLKSCLEKHAPLKQQTLTVRPKVPRYTDELKAMKRERGLQCTQVSERDFLVIYNTSIM